MCESGFRAVFLIFTQLHLWMYLMPNELAVYRHHATAA